MDKINIDPQCIEDTKLFYRKFIPGYQADTQERIFPDIAILKHLIRKYQIKSILEIGTWRGYMGLAMWLEPFVEKFATMDIRMDFQGGGNLYHNNLAFERYGEYLHRCPVRFIVADSQVYTPKPEDECDMVFIDGNHDYIPVVSDYYLATHMATKIIAFHDLENQNPGVDAAVAKLKLPIIRFSQGSIGFVEVTNAGS